jgi:hypothetical protein
MGTFHGGNRNITPPQYPLKMRTSTLSLKAQKGKLDISLKNMVEMTGMVSVLVAVSINV